MQTMTTTQLKRVSGGNDVVPHDHELRIIEIIKKLLE